MDLKSSLKHTLEASSANRWLTVSPCDSMCNPELCGCITFLHVRENNTEQSWALCRRPVCPTGVKEPVQHARYKSVIDGLITGSGHLWLKSCIAGQTENPLIKIPSTHREALKSNRVLEIFELQSQVESVILLRMGEWIYNTLRRPENAEVTHKKTVTPQHTTCVGKCSEHHITPVQPVAS